MKMDVDANMSHRTMGHDPRLGMLLVGAGTKEGGSLVCLQER